MTGARARHVALAASLAMIGWSRALHAEIIHFVNPPEGEPGHFAWQWQYINENDGPLNWLDVTRPSTDQGALVSPNSVGQLSFSTLEPENVTVGGAAVAQVMDHFMTLALDFGDPVQGNEFDTTSLHVGIDFNGGHFSDFEPGVRAYMGVMTISGNFGWIEVERRVVWDGELVAFAWAYETIPGKPIDAGEVPAPGTLALFAFGAVATARRRRRW